MPPNVIDVVLVRPARPANVAAACRAMKNMGLRSLTLVGRPPGLDASEARGLAYGAWDVLDAAREAATLADAVADCTLVVGTSGRPAAGAWTPRHLADQVAALAASDRAALVFGPEATGLTNDELRSCHARVHIPADLEQPSLNLAQAVLLLAYELRLAVAPLSPAVEAEPRAHAEELEAALADLREALLAIGYLDPQSPERLLGEMRALAARARPTRREATLLRGLARQIRWAGGAAALRPAAGGADNSRPDEA